MRLDLAFCASLLIGVLGGCQGDSTTRRGKIYDWMQDPTAENVERIRGQLADEDRDVRAWALFALVSVRVPDSERLARAAMEDGDGFVRATAAKLLGDLQSAPAAQALVRHLLEDPDPLVRQRCAVALAAIGGERAAQGLLGALQDPIKEVRLAGVRGINKLDPALAFDGLARMALQDAEWELRVQAAEGLGRSGMGEAEPVLEAVLRDDNEFVRAAAANALRYLHGEPVPSEPEIKPPAFRPGN